jgi:hypothetical protein
MQTQTQDRLEREELANAKALREMLENFELGENELVLPAYPMHRRGERRDDYSFLPVEADRIELAGFVLPVQFQYHPPPLRVTDGVLEDMMHPESEPIMVGFSPNHRTKVYKARPLPLRCEKCDVECDSYASFTEHCILVAHKKKIDPSRRFDPRFIHARFNDPRHAIDVFETLSTKAKLDAMTKYKEDMEDWFFDSCPTNPKHASPSEISQTDAWENMEENAKMARENVKGDAGIFELSKKEVRAVLRLCTAERAAEVWTSMVLDDFEQHGLSTGSYALDVVENGWAMLDSHGSCSHLSILAGITGLDY